MSSLDKEVSVQSLLLRWPLIPVGLLFCFGFLVVVCFCFCFFIFLFLFLISCKSLTWGKIDYFSMSIQKPFPEFCFWFLFWIIDWLIDWTVFYAVPAIWNNQTVSCFKNKVLFVWISFVIFKGSGDQYVLCQMTHLFSQQQLINIL